MMNMKSIAFGTALFATVFGGCGGDDSTTGPLGNVQSLVILQRPKRNDGGDIFQYTSYVPTARLVTLSPPTADGKQTTICCTQDPAFANVDIQSYDISFDAKSIVFAGKNSDGEHYGLYLLTLADGSIQKIMTDPGRDYVSPVFMPGDKVMFTTNAVVESGAPQHMDEYERGTTIQMGIINLDGSHEELGPRNLSHRTAPSMMSDGRIIFTQWDHLGEENSGHLMIMDQDMTELREAFGKEGKGASNSTLKAREISPGRFVAIATSRDRTIQAGALIDVRLGLPSTDDDGNVTAAKSMSEANSSYVMLTPDVPVDRTPSSNTIGRYYDAFPLNAKEHPDLLVSWADGPVETSVLGAAGLSANFGVYLYDTEHLQRHPILDDPDMWDIFARPLEARTAPGLSGTVNDPTLGGTALIGSMNAYDSTLHTFTPGEIYGVRIMEGFSSEEGFPRMFGTTMFEGHANLGVARLADDGSWLAKVPGNVPVHLQTVDIYGMSLFNEPVWFSARNGESRVCGGCHEDRAKTTIIQPGTTGAAVIGPLNAMSNVVRNNRLSTLADLANPDLIGATGAGTDKLVGMAWDKAIQPVFDAKCVSCHGASNTAGIPGYTITDAMGNVVARWTFNLSNDPVTIDYGMGMTETFSASYFTMAGPDMEALEKNGLMVTGNFKVYMNPEDSHGSLVIQKVNPTKLFPAPDASKRAFDTAQFPPHSNGGANYSELTPAEFYKLILAADMGVNFYARENNPHTTY